MRIIAGSARGIRLQVARGTTARPFLELARGALFNSLGKRVEAARVLDLFAGSGALGIEALSRGAAACLFVEADPRSVEALRDNLTRSRLLDRARILSQPVERTLPSLEGPFDLIFVDPPFGTSAPSARARQTGPVLDRSVALLAAHGLLVLRLEERAEAAPCWPGLVLARERRYGRSRVCLYERMPTEPSPHA